ncbi:Concanavalin A-like lectin/glucanases superfamily protein [Sinosporangium album]|uniref:Concanavalin A-like lectin/glucanases superfamily protein n=1 Tax=Sinosporangium album TaxID=504805 RepID=A0A1G8BRN9_9ACTN|nr:LamG-like jellyroll fold domain-containing protein [Sinosporangium album]SDH35916.1 Concanavalin A-like lectin/glucanases superfamily protein [Sinosporangium album]
MLKLILDQDYLEPTPAVDRTPYVNHGLVTGAAFEPNGRQPGSGALRFTPDSSSVRIAPRQCWRDLRALAIETWLWVEPTGTRRNIIEGDGSFALFVDTDDALTGSVFGLHGGSADPKWVTVSSTSDSPDGVARPLPMRQWCKVVFYHDGIARARLFVDDQLVAARGGYESGVGPVGGAGVVIGNWTLADQFGFDGLIDHVRVFKHDENWPLRAFLSRSISLEAYDQWDRFWECLRCATDPVAARNLVQIGRAWEKLLRRFFAAVHGSGQAQEELERLLGDYKRNWAADTLTDASMIDTIVALRRLLEDLLGPTWLEDASALAHQLREVLGETHGCLDPARLADADPSWAGFIAAASDALQT